MSQFLITTCEIMYMSNSKYDFVHIFDSTENYPTVLISWKVESLLGSQPGIATLKQSSNPRQLQLSCHNFLAMLDFLLIEFLSIFPNSTCDIILTTLFPTGSNCQINCQNFLFLPVIYIGISITLTK